MENWKIITGLAILSILLVIVNRVFLNVWIDLKSKQIEKQESLERFAINKTEHTKRIEKIKQQYINVSVIGGIMYVLAFMAFVVATILAWMTILS